MPFDPVDAYGRPRRPLPKPYASQAGAQRPGQPPLSNLMGQGGPQPTTMDQLDKGVGTLGKVPGAITGAKQLGGLASSTMDTLFPSSAEAAAGPMSPLGELGAGTAAETAQPLAMSGAGGGGGLQSLMSILKLGGLFAGLFG